MKKTRKGFTIVELVIVIAVIAILASVLVPTFSGIVLKAQRSADTQVVRMLNEDVSIGLASGEKTKFDTMYDAVQACIEQGLSPDKIAAKSDYKMAWESTTGRFVLLDTSLNKVIYPQNDTYIEYGINGREIDYFVVTTYDESIEKGNFKYSIYAYGNDWPSELTVNTGFDAGSVKGFKVITYANVDNNTDNVIIHTNELGTKLIINESITNVSHYGFSYLTEIKTLNDKAYNEYGVIGRMNAKGGNIYIDDKASISCLMETTSTNFDISENSNISSQVTNINIDDASKTKDTRGIALTFVKVCNEHDVDTMSKVVIDYENAYYVCQTCGCTLKENDVPANIDTNGEVTNVVSFGLVSTSNKNVLNGCKHDFVRTGYNGNCQIGGNDIYTCSDCGLGYLLPFGKEEHLWNHETHCCDRNVTTTIKKIKELQETTIDEYDFMISYCNETAAVWGEVPYYQYSIYVQKNKLKVITDQYYFRDLVLTSKKIEFFDSKKLVRNLVIGDAVGYGVQPEAKIAVIHSGVETIEFRVFQYCINLETVIIPNTVTYIDQVAFVKCEKLKQIIYQGTSSEWSEIELHQYWNYDSSDFTIHCKDCCIAQDGTPISCTCEDHISKLN